MPDTELLIPMAEIAGVFVGFGALIAVRSAGTTGAELTNIRWVMSCAMWVVIVGLAPALVGSYGLAGHDLLLASSILALVLWATFLAVNARAPENREELRANVAASSPTMMLVYVATLWPPTRVLIGALVLVMLGLLPDHEPALYLTAVGLGLFMSAMGLFVSVFSPRRPQPASKPAELTATGGSSA